MSMTDNLNFNEEQKPNEYNPEQPDKNNITPPSQSPPTKHLENDNENDNDLSDKQSIRISYKNDVTDLSSQNDSENTITPSQTKSFKNEIHSVLNNVFLNYAKYSYEDKAFLLSYQTLTKLLTNMNIITTNTIKTGFHMKPCEFDILAKTICPKKLSKLTLTQFINVIVVLCSKYKPNNFKTNAKKALYNFVQKYFQPISEFINTLNPEGEPCPFIYRQIQRDIESTLTALSPGTKTKQVLTHIQKGLFFLFKLYFPYEVGKRTCPQGQQALEKESLVSLVTLSKTFDLMPQLVSVERIAIYYYCLLNIKNVNLFEKTNTNIGKLFTFEHFCLFLICIANSYFDDISEELWSRFVLLLKKMEDSQGMVKTENTFHVMRPEACSLEVDYELQYELATIDEEEGMLFEVGKAQNEEQNEFAKEVNLKLMSPIKKQNSINYNNNTNTNTKTKYQSSFLQISNNDKLINYDSIQYKGNDWMLLNIFDTYTEIGDKLNFSQMTYTGFLKMLRDFGIIDTKINTSSIQQTQDSNTNTNTQNKNNYLNRHKSMGSFRSSTSRNNTNYFSEIDASIIFYETCGAKHSTITQPNGVASSNINEMNLAVASSTCLDLKTGNVTFRMKFPQFYIALRNISRKIYPGIPMNTAFEQFKQNQLQLKEYTKKIESSYRNIIETINQINNSFVKTILFEFHGLVNVIYTTYADNSNAINFQKCILLLKDFNIFPDVVTLLEIKKTFYTICKLYREQMKSGKELNEFIQDEIQRGNKQNSNDTYDELFTKQIKNEIGNSEYMLYILAICSKSIKNDTSITDIKKIMILFEKMGNSQGVNNPRKFTGNGKLECLSKSFMNIIQSVKHKYPKYFPQNKDNVKQVYQNEDMLSYLFSKDN